LAEKHYGEFHRSGFSPTGKVRPYPTLLNGVATEALMYRLRIRVPEPGNHP
jgi:hypothetical protein